MRKKIKKKFNLGIFCILDADYTRLYKLIFDQFKAIK